MRYILVPLSLRSILLELGILERAEESKKNIGYYIKEDDYLILKNLKIYDIGS